MITLPIVGGATSVEREFTESGEFHEANSQQLTANGPASSSCRDS